MKQDRLASGCGRLARPALLGLMLLASVSTGSAQDARDDQADQADQESARPPGIIPVPEDYASRSHHLAGDLGGRRTDLAQDGLQIDLSLTATGQGVTDGGRETGWASGAKFETHWTLDLDRMEVMPGALVTVRTETRYGDSVNREAGCCCR